MSKKNGSRLKQDDSHRKKLDLPKRKITTKRHHNISKIIDTNKPAAKKSGCTIVSTANCPKKKIF